MPDSPTIVWFRRDLRLDDHPALDFALRRGLPIIPVFILSDEDDGAWSPGGASRVWLHGALADLDASLRPHGLRLVLRKGPARQVMEHLLVETGAGAVAWNRRYEPFLVDRDTGIKSWLKARGTEAWSGNASLLVEPHAVRTQSGNPFQVYTPFYRAASALGVPAPVRVDLTGLKAPASWPASLSLDDLGLLPKIRWDAGIRRHWTPTREAALRRLSAFISDSTREYKDLRDRPDLDATSCLSPYLHFGQIGPREVHAAVTGAGLQATAGGEHFIKELYWREFAHHVLAAFPHTPKEPLRPEFAAFPWKPDGDRLDAWCRGCTGYPIVDAGMRQLWETGWMHNRVRMIVASFLVKHLLQPWQEGSLWFWDTLVDADLAQNTLGWQWTAGCGADAAPYFRIFNPVTQGMKFDPEGRYVRRWVPELAAIPDAHVHAPWEAPPQVRARAVVYPGPIVGNAEGRAAALAALAELKDERSRAMVARTNAFEGP